MLTILINVLVALLILVVVLYVVRLGVSQFGLPDAIFKIISLILGLVWLLYTLKAFGIVTP